MLEAGAFVPEPEMPADELGAFDRLYLNHGFNVSWDASIMTLAGTGVGGGTLVNWMTCIDPPASTRRHWAASHGLASFEDPVLDADLAALAAEIGVSDAPNVPPKDQLILRGCTMLRQEVGEIRRNGIDCGDCGRCGFGCRRGAKQSGIRVHLAEAWRHGTRIIPDAPVERVLVEEGRARGRRGDGLDRAACRGGSSSGRRRSSSRPGALRTPIVLERSGIDHPATGRHLRLHPVGVIGAFLDEDVAMWRGTMQAARALHHLDLDGDGTGDGPGDAPSGFIVESAPGTPGLIALVFPWEGRDAFEGLMGRIRRVAPIIGIVRERGSGSIRLSRAGRPRIDYTLSALDRQTLGAMLAEAARIAWEGGSREMVAVGTPPRWFRADRDGDERAFGSWQASLRSFPYQPNRGTVVSAHQMGSARAGDDPARHTADPVGRIRQPDARPGRDRDDRGPVRRRRVRVPERPGREPDDDDDGVGAAGRPDGARGGRRAGRLGRAFLGARPRPGVRDAAARAAGSGSGSAAAAGCVRPRPVTISATAATITTPATIVRGVSGSDRTSQPRITATTGLT